ncbi:MAG: hypothetical protein R2708_20125 [Vicinamibacterales bacterium]
MVGIELLVEGPAGIVFRGEPPVAARGRSSTSAGQESTMPWRFTSVAQPMAAPGNAASTMSWISWAVGANAPTLYAVLVSASRGTAASRSRAFTPSGIAMNGMRVSGAHKQA